MVRRNWIGIVLIMIGLAIAVHQMGLVDLSVVLSNWWPFIFIIIGIIQLSNKGYTSRAPGVIFILVGGFLLANTLFGYDLSNFIWPVILIAIGLIFLFNRTSHKKMTHTKDTLECVTLFSGAGMRSHSEHFKGGQVTSIFGGAQINLREATMDENGAHLELTTIFGGITVLVPDDVYVDIKGTPIFGGWENKTRAPVSGSENAPVLTIQCLTIFGGVEVKE
jgi:predicted membrane protein